MLRTLRICWHAASCFASMVTHSLRTLNVSGISLSIAWGYGQTVVDLMDGLTDFGDDYEIAAARAALTTKPAGEQQ